jgi:hypothetical protein
MDRKCHTAVAQKHTATKGLLFKQKPVAVARPKTAAGMGAWSFPEATQHLHHEDHEAHKGQQTVLFRFPHPMSVGKLQVLHELHGGSR